MPHAIHRAHASLWPRLDSLTLSLKRPSYHLKQQESFSWKSLITWPLQFVTPSGWPTICICPLDQFWYWVLCLPLSPSRLVPRSVSRRSVHEHHGWNSPPSLSLWGCRSQSHVADPPLIWKRLREALWIKTKTLIAHHSVSHQCIVRST